MALTKDANIFPMGYTQYGGLSSAVQITPPAGAQLALIQAEAQNIRWRDDGTNPDASTGMLLEAGNDIWYTGVLSEMRLIEVASGGIANVSFYGLRGIQK